MKIRRLRTQPAITCSKLTIETRRREVCLKLTIKTPERQHWCHLGVFIVNFEHMSRLVLLLLLLTLSRKIPVGNILKMKLLIHFMPLVSFYTPWKHQKTKGFLMFSGDVFRGYRKRPVAWNRLRLHFVTLTEAATASVL